MTIEENIQSFMADTSVVDNLSEAEAIDEENSFIFSVIKQYEETGTISDSQRYHVCKYILDSDRG